VCALTDLILKQTLCHLQPILSICVSFYLFSSLSLHAPHAQVFFGGFDHTQHSPYRLALIQYLCKFPTEGCRFFADRVATDRHVQQLFVAILRDPAAAPLRAVLRPVLLAHLERNATPSASSSSSSLSSGANATGTAAVAASASSASTDSAAMEVDTATASSSSSSSAPSASPPAQSSSPPPNSAAGTAAATSPSSSPTPDNGGGSATASDPAASAAASATANGAGATPGAAATPKPPQLPPQPMSHQQQQANLAQQLLLAQQQMLQQLRVHPALAACLHAPFMTAIIHTLFVQYQARVCVWRRWQYGRAIK
jgi:hypothetical protein